MIGKIKKALGIEGVSLQLEIPETISINMEGALEGEVIATSKNDSIIKNITIKVIEKYQRGRRKSKLIDEYVIGYTEIEGPITITKGEILNLPFICPIKLKLSEVERFGNKNFLFGSISKVAKLMKGASSSYRVEAEAYVEGTMLHPLDKKVLVID